jgi:hypothetical protein
MRSILIALALVVSCAALAAAEIEISDCGAVIPSGEVGVLSRDLDCATVTKRCVVCDKRSCAPSSEACADIQECSTPGSLYCAFPAAVTLRRGATLDLAGHAIVGGPNCTAAVRCADGKGPCAVTSSTARGRLSGQSGVFVTGAARLEISNVDISDCEGSGIYSPVLAARVVASSVTVTDNGGSGISARDITATDLTAAANGDRGLDAQGRLRGSAITVADNASFGAISVKPVELDGFTATGNGAATAEGSGAGLWALRGGYMANSTLSGNVYQAAGGPIPMDILSGRPLRLVDSTCIKSGGNGSLTAGWGVCSGD